MKHYDLEEVKQILIDKEELQAQDIFAQVETITEMCRAVVVKAMTSPTAWAEKPQTEKWDIEIDYYIKRSLEMLIKNGQIKVVKEVILDA